MLKNTETIKQLGTGKYFLWRYGKRIQYIVRQKTKTVMSTQNFVKEDYVHFLDFFSQYKFSIANWIHGKYYIFTSLKQAILTLSFHSARLAKVSVTCLYM